MGRREEKQLDAELKKLSSHKQPERQKEQSKADDSLPTLLSSFNNMERRDKGKRDGNDAGRQREEGKDSGSLPTLLVASRNPQAMVSAVGSKSRSDSRMQSSNDKRKSYGRGKSKSLPLLEESLAQICARKGTSEYDAQGASGTVLVLGGVKFYRKEPTDSRAQQSRSDRRITPK